MSDSCCSVCCCLDTQNTLKIYCEMTDDWGCPLYCHIKRACGGFWLFFCHFLFPAEFVPVRSDMAVVERSTAHPVPIRAIVAESGKLPLTSCQVHLENTGREEGRDPPGMSPMISNPVERNCGCMQKERTHT